MPTTARRMWSARGAHLVAALAVLLTLAGLLLAAVGPSPGSAVVDNFPLGVAYCAVGCILLLRRPDNPIGSLFAFSGLCDLVAGFARAYATLGLSGSHLPGTIYAASATQWAFAPGLAPGLVLPLLLFPDGRPLSPRWRWVSRAAWLATALMTVSGVLTPGRLINFPRDNPLGVNGVAALQVGLLLGSLLLVVCMSLGVVSVVLRFRRSHATERLQMRWFIYGAVVAAGGLVISVVLSIVNNSGGIGIVLLGALPVCMGIAILRYRLYDIDRVISRTLGYALASALVLVPYLALVFGVGRAVASPTAVAVLTLLAAVVARPLHQRVQARVDHRFNRARFDGALTVEAFAGRLRTTIDLDALRDDLARAVTSTMEPASLSLWVRPT